MNRRLSSAFWAVLLCAAMLVFSYRGTNEQNITDTAMSDAETGTPVSAQEDDALILWYADEALTEFLTTEALSYQAETGTHVVTKLVSGVDYLEQINTASVYDGETSADGTVYEAPDLYVTTHDTLLRAYLSGLAGEITDPHEVVIRENYPQTSLCAISCDDKYTAYPLCYETNFFLYNKTYMRDIASAKVEEQIDRQEGEAAQAAVDATDGKPADGDQKADDEKKDDEKKDEDKKEEEKKDDDKKDESKTDEEKKDEEKTDGDEEGDSETDEEGLEDEEGDPMGEEDVTASPEVLKQLATIIPSTIDDIRYFANNYDAPEAVEAVFKWDVSDIFYNYFFVGNYMNVGGDNGDSNSVFNIYNQQAVECLQVYQDLNSFFSIDAKEVSYDKILQEFLDGKTVFTVATTDAVRKIEQAKLDGDFDFEYGISVLPDVSSTLKARGLSVTTCLAVNGYSDKKEAANDLASYLSFEKGQELYRKAGRLSCRRGCVYDNNEIYNVMNEYEKSVSLPKMVETSNFWVQLEIAFTQIWNGADPDETLRTLSDTIGGQIEEIDFHIPVQESIGAGGGAVLLP
ncbi:MAG: sugar ABC transporter substrate-binding protein [Lachnospiraceae bacterium]|nr:sugar ABC transporter substrate-binding protein [Lachnospiraceae bacterium]